MMKFSLIGAIKRLFMKLNCCNSQCFNNSVNLILDERIEEHINNKVLELIQNHLNSIGYNITYV